MRHKHLALVGLVPWFFGLVAIVLLAIAAFSPLKKQAENSRASSAETRHGGFYADDEGVEYRTIRVPVRVRTRPVPTGSNPFSQLMRDTSNAGPR